MIKSFTGKYRFLSNFYPCWIKFEGAKYPSVEHAYQAAKTTDEQLRLWFQEPIVTAGEAKKAGRRLKIRPDWEDIKLDIMYQLCLNKFHNPIFMIRLFSTKEEELIEGNTWGDKFWGICNGEGHNHLGKILMQIRERLKNTCPICNTLDRKCSCIQELQNSK